MPGTPNTLYYGDNLDILRRYVADERVDLVYLDPPFNSARNYNVLFAEQDGTRAAAQIRAFEDTWRWDSAAAAAFEEVVEQGGRSAEAMRAFRVLLGDSDMLAYLSMMAPRLVELRRALKLTGSLYLHCDPTASHYLKVLLDAVFGPENFRNEITWKRTSAHNSARRYGPVHDVIFFYSRSDAYKRYLDEVKGTPLQDVWTDIPPIGAQAAERLGYPTQKPEALLERIIAASSAPGDVVLDPFCGCGTTIAAAQKLDRRWIGIDITHLAINLLRTRLRDTYGDSVRFDVIGEPTTVEDAEELARTDPYQFQWWALGLVGARPAEHRKGADKGIDGRLYFHDHGRTGKATRQAIFSVKAGNVTSSQVRDLVGVLTREKAELGALISFEEPTRDMRKEAASAGFYESPWGKHPKIQLLTVGELLEGKSVDMPRTAGTNRTFKAAPKAKRVREPHPELFGD